MLKNTARILSIFVLCTVLLSWGAKGHYTINYKCPESFPTSMVGFKVWADSLSLHASDADNRKSSDSNESPKHFIDIDNYTEFNSTGRIASTYDSIVKIHGASTVLSNGTLPWATRNMYDTLKVDFQKRKWHKAMLDASDLGHYVADGHMPMHITANYDGQNTGQTGIHSRYESTMVSYYNTNLANYSGSTAHLVSNVNTYVLSYIYTNHHYVDSVLAADTYATKLAGNTTSTSYYTALWSKTQFTVKLFQNASHALADLIYSAWVEAGSPVFGTTSLTDNVNPTVSNSVVVYPNPSTGIVKLKGNSSYKTEVCNLAGTKVGEYYGSQLDLSHLSKGMYILRISGEGGLTREEKLRLTN